MSVRSRLQGIVLDGVKSDGTMDLLVSSKLERAPVRFVFNSPKGEGPQPSHPPGTRLRREYCGRQDVQIDRSGIYAVPDQPLTNCHGVGDELPEPHCGLKKIWEYAIKHGAPPDAVAHIEYYSAEAGPAWRFDILSSHTNFVLYGDCERELSPSEAAGSVPH